MGGLGPAQTLVIAPEEPEGRAAASLFGYLGVSAKLLERRHATVRVDADDGRAAGFRAVVRRVRREETERLGGHATFAWVLEPFLFDWLSRGAFREIEGDRGEASVGRIFGDGGRAPPWFAKGSSDEAPGALLAASGRRTLERLDTLYGRCDGYLSGRRPSLVDFFVYGACRAGGASVAESVGADELRRRLDWLERMELPHPVSALRAGAGLEPGEFRPLVAELAGTYWRVLEANARGWEEGSETTAVTLVDGRELVFEPDARGLERWVELLRRLERVAEEDPALLAGKGLGLVELLGETLEGIGSNGAVASRVGSLESLRELVGEDERW